ncbi:MULTISPECIES: pentapeptide repeat-containing protein [unclassified Yoonia]|uniref:pentapeptide repeat-containing protein n=1 Tax=unclassified Yoonia TaxID=2629118 RepID=UPI002AFF0A60|nr:MULTISPECIES: pentapeptide repeat-containing protein [unclassified Yoonia]
MADTEDLADLKSGARDLVGSVLDGADLRGFDLRGRDFGRANLKNADFSGSDLEGCNFAEAKLAYASFRAANLAGSNFTDAMPDVDFSFASLKSTRIDCFVISSRFHRANLEFADFRGSTIDEGCDFTETIVNEETNFEGVKALRLYLKEAAFKYYDLRRSTLFKRVEKPHDEVGLDQVSLVALRAIDEGLRNLDNFSEVADYDRGRAQIGHNQPPLEFAIDPQYLQEVKKALEDARDTISSGEKDETKLKRAIEKVRFLARTAMDWIAWQANNFATEFAKEAGKTIGSKTAFIVMTAHFSGAMTELSNFLAALLS